MKNLTWKKKKLIPGMRVRIRSNPLIFGPPDPDPLPFSLDPDPSPIHLNASLYTLILRGLVMWGEEVQGLLDDAKLLVQQAASNHGPGLVSLLIEGAPNSGNRSTISKN